MQELKAGLCFVNAQVRSDPRLPLGGIKDSVYERELPYIGTIEFVNIKAVLVAEPQNFVPQVLKISRWAGEGRALASSILAEPFHHLRGRQAALVYLSLQSDSLWQRQ